VRRAFQSSAFGIHVSTTSAQSMHRDDGKQRPESGDERRMIRLDGNREDFGDNTREEIVCDG
jgi:hypothetical protein